MDHSTHTLLVDSELTEANLLDAVVYGIDDEKIGTVAHVHGMGAATQVIVDVGGFLGIGAKPVSLYARCRRCCACNNRLDQRADQGAAGTSPLISGTRVTERCASKGEAAV
jgi:PRC-barrel domain